MLMLAAVGGGVLLAALALLCFTAYIIGAETFEFSAAILRLVSLSLKIKSPTRRAARVRRTRRTVDQDTNAALPKRNPRSTALLHDRALSSAGFSKARENCGVRPLPRQRADHR
jgi:hypothetical protein